MLLQIECNKKVMFLPPQKIDEFMKTISFENI